VGIYHKLNIDGSITKQLLIVVVVDDNTVVVEVVLVDVVEVDVLVDVVG
jgi:hypothetical protein